MKPAELQAATGCQKFLAELYAPHLTAAIQKYGITNVPEFVAQCAHESDLFESVEENLSYSVSRLMQVWPKRFPTPEVAALYARNPVKLGDFVYGGRMGNDYPGDGFKYRGRGLIQLTGADNYLRYGAYHDPDRLLTPEGAADSAAWYWTQIGGCNGLTDVDEITRRVNGGTNGLEERRSLTEMARAALKPAPTRDAGVWERAYAWLRSIWG